MTTDKIYSRISRKAYFSSGHRYFNPNWSEEKNREVYGSCFAEVGHGHNYVLEASFEGAIDDDSGMIANLKDIDRVLKEAVEPLDHHHLNFDVEYFKTKVPTTENLAVYLFNEIAEKSQKAGLPAKLYKVRVYESDDLWADCSSNNEILS